MKISVIFVALEVLVICSQADSETVETSSYLGEKVIHLPEYEPVFIAFRCDFADLPDGYEINLRLSSSTITFRKIRFSGFSASEWHIIIITRKFMMIKGHLIELHISVAQTFGWTLTVSSYYKVQWDTESYSYLSSKCAVPEVTEPETFVAEDTETEFTTTETIKADTTATEFPGCESTVAGKQPCQSDWRTIALLAVSLFTGITILVLIAYIQTLKKKKMGVAGAQVDTTRAALPANPDENIYEEMDPHSVYFHAEREPSIHDSENSLYGMTLR